MDKKNFLLGVICLFVAFLLFVKQEKQVHEHIESATVPEVVQVVKGTPKRVIQERLNYNVPTFAPSSLVTLENDFVKVHFSKVGGAIHSVELKHYLAEQGGSASYVFNQGGPLPALTLAWDQHKTLLSSFETTELTDRFIQFSCVLPDGTKIIRGYRLADSKAQNPYEIKNEFRIEQTQLLHNHVWVCLGIMPDTPGDKYQEFLNFCTYDGKEVKFKRVADFEASSGFLGMGQREAHDYFIEHSSIPWAALKNQFFVSILTPKTAASGSEIVLRKNVGQHLMLGFLKFDLDGPQSCISSTYYVGPKDYLLLDKMGHGQDQLMQFGWFGAVSKILLMSMRGINTVISNWGWTIIVLTIIIKLLMWPITQAQLRSSKKMSSIQKPLQQIREKFKNNPQKLQAETMKLFKENRVNPATGCLPVFIQIPIFIGLYYMLRTSSEIRYQSFLWIKDLSIPDTVAMIGSFPVNILPIIMGVTMFIQMKVTPTPSMDGMQQKIIMCMPFIFLIFCYSFPAALVLYWTVQNLFTIFQQWLTNRYTKKTQPIILKN